MWNTAAIHKHAQQTGNPMYISDAENTTEWERDPLIIYQWQVASMSGLSAWPNSLSMKKKNILLTASWTNENMAMVCNTWYIDQDMVPKTTGGSQQQRWKTAKH
jgi:hypothetical protein